MRKNILLLCLIHFFLIPKAIAVEAVYCKLDDYFERSDSYKQKKIYDINSKIENEENDLSLLPSLSISTGQYSSNDKGFKGVTSNSLSLSLSSELYSGNRYGKMKEKLQSIDEMNEISLEEKRNAFYLDMMLALYDYKYLHDQLDVLRERLTIQEKLVSKSAFDYKAGRISKLDSLVNINQLQQIEQAIKKLELDIKKDEVKFQLDFNVSSRYIMSISPSDFLSCKKMTAQQLLHKKHVAEYEKEKAIYELNKSSLSPSVYFSLSMSPSKNGQISDFNFSKADYIVSVNASVSLSSLFSKSILDERNYTSYLSEKINKDSELKILKKKVFDVRNEIENIESELHFMSEDILLKKENLEFFHERYLKKEGTIQEYYSQLEQYITAEIYLKKKERELEYYKTYYAFIN